MRIKRVIPILLLILMVLSCITPLDVKTDREVNLLVIEGSITTLPGPYKISITKSARYGSVFDGVIRPEISAEVWIKDGEGNITFLTDFDGNGVYETPPNFRGEIGKTYTLNVISSLGVEYASLPETLTAVPDLDSVYFEYKKLPTTDPVVFSSGLEVYGIWEDPGDQENYYMWRNRGSYFVITFPEDFVIPGPDMIPAPKACCKECYISETNGDAGIYIHKDNNTNGSRTTELVAFLEDDGARFTDGYLATIQQLSISKEAFQFFSLLRNQKSIDGDIFDPPPATVRGNIYPLDPDEEPVIGYFFASDAKEYTAFGSRDQLEDFQSGFVLNDDCRVLRGSSVVPPPGWPE